MKPSRSDTELWEAFKMGDREAFSELFRKYYPELILYGGKIAQERQVLEDAIQELFLEIWKSNHQSVVLSVRSYLFKSLKYKLFRVLAQGKERPLQELREEMAFELSHDTIIIQKEADREKANQVIQAFDQLSNRQKEIIYLKYYLGLGYEEISEVMEINYQVARNLLYLAIRSMKKMISAVKLVIFLLSLIL